MKPALNLRQVESFYSVMRTGTVVAAARHMNVTQPVVSRAISLLEARIGYNLFERKGRKLVATPEGDAFYREAEPIYGSLDRLAQVGGLAPMLERGVAALALVAEPEQVGACMSGLADREQGRGPAGPLGQVVGIEQEHAAEPAELAQQRETSVPRLKAELQKEGRLGLLKHQIREEKTVDFLLGKAKISGPLADAFGK